MMAWWKLSYALELIINLSGFTDSNCITSSRFLLCKVFSWRKCFLHNIFKENKLFYFYFILLLLVLIFFFWDPKIFFLLFFFSTLGQRYPYISKWVFLGQMDNKQKGFILYVFAKFLIRMVRIVVKRRWELIICGAWSWGEQCIFCSNH